MCWRTNSLTTHRAESRFEVERVVPNALFNSECAKRVGDNMLHLQRPRPRDSRPGETNFVALHKTRLYPSPPCDPR
jgi:hypothetical protein